MASIIRESTDDKSVPEQLVSDGMQLQLAGRLEQAERLYRSVLDHDPGHAAANYCIGMLRLQSQRAADGIAHLLRALESNPQSPDYWLGFLESLLASGRTDEAAEALTLGARHGLAGRAVEEFRARLALAAAEHAEARLLRAMQEGAVDTALELARHLTATAPQRGIPWKVLGALLWARGDRDAALQCMQNSVQRLPRDAEAHCNFGFALAKIDRFAEAERCLERALAIDPRFATAHYRLGATYLMQTRLAEAEACLRRGLECRAAYIDGDDEANFSTLLFLMAHDADIDADALFAEHQRFGALFEKPDEWSGHDNDRDPARRLRVGLVSGDLREHALADYLEPLLAHLQGRPGIEVHAYYSNPVEDEVSRRLKALVAGWHDIAVLTNAALADRVRADRIDVLVDLSGHTALNRLPAFARKPAPVQVSTMGYPGTTGLRAMDYYLTDPGFLPPGDFERYFTEKLVYLPAQAPFRPHTAAPPVNRLPALVSGKLTFGSFNRPEKINRATVELWSRVLRELPDSKMIVGGIRLDRDRARLLHEFATCGIPIDRLQLHPPYDMDTYLRLHHAVDLCLDTLPWNGGTTTIHALWMGVPTLTLAGTTPAGRCGATILGAIDLHTCIARDADEFIAAARHWSQHLPALARLRAELRGRWQASSRRNAGVIAGAFEAALRRMWRRWCEGLPPESFTTAAVTQLAAPASQPTAVQSSGTGKPRRKRAERLPARYAKLGAEEAERALLRLVEGRDVETALPLARRLTQRHPERGVGWKILGAFLPLVEGHEAALPALRRAVELLPYDAEAHVNLGLTLAKAKRPEEGEVFLKRALVIDPTFAAAHYRLAVAYAFMGRFADCEASLRRGIALGNNRIVGDDELSRSHLLFLMSHNPDIGSDELFEEHVRFGEHIEGALRAHWPAHANVRDPERVLKVGIVSGDLCNHAVASFLEPLLVELATLPGFELHAYYTNPSHDTGSERLLGKFKSWNVVWRLTDEELAGVILKDRIDILLDLSGHTAFNRLPAFARKPAPVQVTWMGYPGTTGLRAMDYFLADPYFLPPGQFEQHFTETFAYIPTAPFQPPEGSPEVGELPALVNGRLTLGAFNRLGKTNDASLALWAELLRELPDAHLLFAGIELGTQDVALTGRFARLGIAPERLHFRARCGVLSYLALFNEVDLCLDTFPYNGGTTTLNALWMGVPTLTIAGATPAARQGAAILGQLGLDEFIAADRADFIARGKHWAVALPALARLRGQLRARLLNSPERRADVLAGAVAEALRRMWRRWCAGLPPEAFHTAAALRGARPGTP